MQCLGCLIIKKVFLGCSVCRATDRMYFKSHCQSCVYHRCEGSPQSGQSSPKGWWVGGLSYEKVGKWLYVYIGGYKKFFIICTSQIILVEKKKTKKLIYVVRETTVLPKYCKSASITLFSIKKGFWLGYQGNISLSRCLTGYSSQGEPLKFL